MNLLLALLLLCPAATELVERSPQSLDTSVSSTEGLLAVAYEQHGTDPLEALTADLRQWDPDTEDRRSPPACLAPERRSWAGTWSLGRRYDSSTFTITEEEGSIQVELHTGGCLQSWTTNRIGRSFGSRLELSGPVKEYYATSPFRRLHLVQVRGDVYIVPSVYLQCVLDVVEAKGCDGISFANAGGCMFGRSP